MNKRLDEFNFSGTSDQREGVLLMERVVFSAYFTKESIHHLVKQVDAHSLGEANSRGFMRGEQVQQAFPLRLSHALAFGLHFLRGEQL